MAGKKIQAQLTPEEKLQQALVPEAEQPYKVPDNWCWTYWGNCGEFIAGNAFKKDYQGFQNYHIPFYKVGSLKYSDDNGILYDNSNTINDEILKILKATLIPVNSIIFAKIGEAIRLNRRSINNKACCIDNNLMAFVSKVGFWKYFYFWSLQLDLYDYTNATTVPAIRKSDLEGIEMPLPPLAEQQRIVERLETLFAKLDEAKEKLQNTLDTFETRKAAILRKAFTGELTANWRKQHGISMDSWEMCEFNQIADIKTNLVNPIDFQSYPHIAPDNIEKKTGKLLYYNSVAEDNVKSGKHRFYAGQILYSKIRPYLSKVIIAEFDGLCSADMYPIEAKGNTRFLWYYMLSEHFVYQASTAGSRTVLPKINQKELSKLKINMPTLSEQTEIVRIIDDLLAKEQQAHSVVQNALAKIDLIKKSILARAFRGQLATNNPADEPALKLLERVL